MKTYKLFIEALRDNLVLLNKTHNNEILYSDMEEIKDKPFLDDAELIPEIEHKGRTIPINYYHNEKTHNIIKRIKERTRCFSISHYNDVFSEVFKRFINNNRLEDGTVRYALYLKEHKFYIIVEIDKKRFYSENPLINVVTIMIGYPQDEKLKIIEINDYMIV